MKKKGFTLIELLAVIVVLAIIALIATPIVMNTIKNSKKGAAERTADNYVEQVETSLMTYRLENGENLPDGEYQITSDGNLCKDKTSSCKEKDQIKIEMNGTKPSSGSIVVENGQVKKESSSMTVGDYTVKYDTDNKTFVASEKVEVLCKAVTELSTQYVFDMSLWDMVQQQTGVLASDGDPYAYGVEYTCELGDGEEKTFYVLETSGNSVSLIMNMNIDSEGKGTTEGNAVVWVTKEDYIAAGGDIDEEFCECCGYCGTNEYGPVTALAYLKKSTINWIKLDSSQISMPTYDQIYKAAGNKTSGISTWLVENLYNNSVVGYWTSTPSSYDSKNVWIVECQNFALRDDFSSIDESRYFGIRPVITISKLQLG